MVNAIKKNKALKNKEMNQDILFQETQKFNQWWLWAILISVNAMLIYGVVDLYLLDEHQISNESDRGAIWFVLILIPLLTMLFLTFRLDTLVKANGVYFRFFPIHRKYRYYSWEQIAKIFLRQYSPLIEYGGWGIRYGLFGKGMAYNIKGNNGLQLFLKNKKKLLIGTQRPEELRAVLERLRIGNGSK